MRFERQYPIRPGPFDLAGDGLRRDRCPGVHFPVLPGGVRGRQCDFIRYGLSHRCHSDWYLERLISEIGKTSSFRKDSLARTTWLRAPKIPKTEDPLPDIIAVLAPS